MQVKRVPTAPATCIAVQTPWLPAQVSLPAVTAVLDLVNRLTAGSDDASQQGDDLAPPDGSFAAADDLRSGLFVLAVHDGQALAPLQVSLASSAVLRRTGQSGEELMRHVISWMYPQPRAVGQVRFQVSGACSARVLGHRGALAHHARIAPDAGIWCCA